jgi:hypothetical protein
MATGCGVQVSFGGKLKSDLVVNGYELTAALSRTISKAISFE